MSLDIYCIFGRIFQLPVCLICHMYKWLKHNDTKQIKHLPWVKLGEWIFGRQLDKVWWLLQCPSTLTLRVRAHCVGLGSWGKTRGWNISGSCHTHWLLDIHAVQILVIVHCGTLGPWPLYPLAITPDFNIEMTSWNNLVYRPGVTSWKFLKEPMWTVLNTTLYWGKELDPTADCLYLDI